MKNIENLDYFFLQIHAPTHPTKSSKGYIGLQVHASTAFLDISSYILLKLNIFRRLFSLIYVRYIFIPPWCLFTCLGQNFQLSRGISAISTPRQVRRQKENIVIHADMDILYVSNRCHLFLYLLPLSLFSSNKTSMFHTYHTPSHTHIYCFTSVELNLEEISLSKKLREYTENAIILKLVPHGLYPRNCDYISHYSFKLHRISLRGIRRANFSWSNIEIEKVVCL